MELKPGYKRSEVGVIPGDWMVKPISQVAPLQRGFDLPTREIRPGPFPVVYSNGVKNFHNVAMVKGPGVVTGRSGTLGKVHYIDTDYWPHNTSLWVTHFNDNIPKFIYYLYKSLSFGRFASGSGVPTLNRNDAHSYHIALPSDRNEQRAIAATLSDVDALLGGLDRLIAKKRDLKQAAMQQLLTGQTRLPGFHGEWEVKRLGDVAEIVMGQSPSSAYYNTRGNGLPLIQGNTDISNRKTVPRVFTTEVTKRARAGDILMSVRAPVGEVSHVTFDACLGRGVCAIRFPNNFLYHYLVFLEPTWAKHSKGSTFDSVNSNDVKAVEIEFPMDVDEQAVIASVLSDMDAELAALEARRDKTRDLKQAMMQELLTGKTRLVAVGGAHA